MIRKIKYYIAGILILVLAGAGWWLLRPKGDSGEKIVIEEARVADLRAIARLCTTEFYREASVLDTVNQKVIFGIQKQRGTISFDIEALPEQLAVVRDTTLSDTLRLKLPAERIEVLESTEKDAWRVVDTKSLKFLGSDNMIPEEENLAKNHAISETKRRLYADGTVSRSRKEAAETLSRLLSAITSRPVIVTP